MRFSSAERLAGSFATSSSTSVFTSLVDFSRSRLNAPKRENSGGSGLASSHFSFA